MHQLLMEHENTCHRTCFSVRLGGVSLDSHTKISSIQGVQEGAVIKLEEGNYLLFYFFLTFRGYYSQHQHRIYVTAHSPHLCFV